MNQAEANTFEMNNLTLVVFTFPGLAFAVPVFLFLHCSKKTVLNEIGEFAESLQEPNISAQIPTLIKRI